MADGGVIVPPPHRFLRCRTAVGVFAEDWREFCKPAYETENRVRFQPTPGGHGVRAKRSTFMLAKLDGGRRHNPHAPLARHINRHGKKPICAVRTLLDEEPEDKSLAPSMYTTQFKYEPPKERRIIVYRKDYEKKAEGIIPKNSITSRNDVREEMMLPVGESVEIPSLENPHTFFPRRKRIQTPYLDEGVFYSESQCSAANSITGQRSKMKTGITNLTGREFTRRRFVAPPRTTLTVPGFDGGPPPAAPDTFQTAMMPFMRAKTII